MEKSKNIILSASRMTDMSAFYPEALIFEVENRLRKGLSIHTLVLWTKHPKSLFAPPLYFHLLQWQSKGIQIYVQLTITGMGGVMVGQDGDGNPIILEPGVPSMKETLDFVPRVIDLADSPDRICLRIDPLIRIMDSTGYKYSNFEMLSYLIKAGSAMGIQNFTFSFLEKGMHQKVDKIFLKKGLTISSPNSAERKIWKEELGKLEKKYKITISACCVQGFETSRCIDGYGLEKLHNLSIPVSKKEPKSRPLCGCTESIDLGGWPPKLCFSGCLYCYARPSTHRLTK